jgi:hypothetical protein
MATITRTSDRDRERLRRAAGGREQGPTIEEQSGGGFPFSDLITRIGDPQDPTNVSFPFLRRMRRDHMISMGLHFIMMPLLKAGFYFESSDARAAALADNLVRPIYGRLLLSILRFLWAGYSPGAKTFKAIQPGWTYLPGVGQEPKKVWDNGNIAVLAFDDVIPLRPELCRPQFANGKFNGIKYDSRYGSGWFIINGQSKREIDLLHSVWATHGQEGEDNSIYGFPRIAHVAPIYHSFWYLWTLLGRAWENNADPGPVVGYPRDEAPLLGEDNNQVKNVQTALRLGRYRRSGSTIAMPSDTYTDFQDRPGSARKWYLEYPKVQPEFEQMINWLGQLEAAKLRGLWIPEQGVIEGSGGTSSRNVAAEFSDLRDESQFVLKKQIDDLIVEIFVKPALAMHLPDFEGTISMRTIGLGGEDQEIVRQFFQLIGQSPDGGWKNFGVDARKLAEMAGVPMLDPAEQAKQLREAAAAASAAPTPPVEPNQNQGRRALVTQTGFGETTYVQLEDPISLADDGGFVTDLPKTQHFTDKTVVAGARELRGYARAYLKALYDDFAMHVSKQMKTGLADELDLAEEDGKNKLADRLLASWKPRLDRTITFGQRAKRAMGKVFDRAAKLKLKDLISDTSVSSNEERAAKWLDEHGATLTTGVTDTVRQELRDFMAREVQAGTTPEDLAARIREEFSQWPGWKADRIARTETSRAFNFATLAAGRSAGIKKVQILDGQEDEPCRKRNGKIIDITRAFSEDLAHPRCTLGFRLLPNTNLEIRRVQLEGGLLGRYDETNETILLSPDISPEDETKFLLGVGEWLTEQEADGETLAA